MIRTGTRVIVLTSTLKEGIGPRRGSIGYITNKKVSLIRFHETFKTFVSLVNVVFIRYGFDSKQRKEHKFFVNMIPILTDGDLRCLEDFTDPVAIKEYLDSRLNELSKVNLLAKADFWRQVRNELVRTYGLNPKNIKAGVLVPTSRPDLLTCDDMEFMAWLDAMLADSNIYNAILHLTRTTKKRVLDIIDKATLTLLFTVMGDQKHKQTMLVEYAATPEHRKYIIRTLRAVSAIAHRRDKRQKREEVTAYLVGLKSSKKQLIPALRSLYTPSYCEPEFLWKAQLLFANRKDKSPINISLNGMTGLRCLGQDLEKRKADLTKNTKGKKGAACKTK